MRDHLRTLEKWEQAIKAGNMEHLRGLHAEGSKLVREGLGPASHAQDAYEAAEDGKATKTRWHITEPRVQGETIYAKATEKNDWLEAAGIEKAHYDAEFKLRDGKIEALHLYADSETKHAAEAAFTEFMEWAAKEKPHHLAELMHEGKLRHNAENSEKFTEMLHQWKKAAR